MKHSIIIHAGLSELARLRAALADFIGTALDEKDKGRVILAVDEAVSNVIIHGYNSDESKTVCIEMHSDESAFTFIITDKAKLYNPLESPLHDMEDHHDCGKNSGLGVDIYRKIMKVYYEQGSDGSNRLIMIKEKKSEKK